MQEFTSVPVPVFFPQACVGCMSQKGPMVDTHRELPGNGHVYICSTCWERGGRALGTLEGDKRGEILDNTRQLAQRDTEVAQLNRKLVRQAETLAANKKLLAELAETLEWAEGRIAQLESAISEDAKARLAIVEAH